MANLRGLKKDIDYLISEIISDCQLFMYLHPKDKRVEEAWKIIGDAVEIRNQLYDRVNHPDGKDNKKIIKNHYSSVRKDLLQNAHSIFEQISALNNK